MGRVAEILEQGEEVSRQEMRSEIGGGRSTPFAKFRKVALDREPGGPPKKYTELTESEVSSIRTQVNHLNPDDLENGEKEFVVTRTKMKNDAGEDIKSEDGEQLYKVFIRRDQVQGQNGDPAGSRGSEED